MPSASGADSLLFYATARGDMEEVYRLLSEENANINASNANGTTPCHIAAAKVRYPKCFSPTLCLLTLRSFCPILNS